MKTNLTLQMLVDYGDTHTMYETIEYAATFNKLTYPTRPTKVFASKNATPTELRDVADKMEKYVELYEEYKKEVTAYTEANGEIFQLIELYIKEQSGLNRIPEQYRDKVYSKAYADGHSSGYNEVYNHLCELVDIFN